MAVLRLLIVDDSLTIRAMLEEILERHSHFDIVGMASNAAQAIQAIDHHLPDVVLLDLGLPDMNGVDLLDSIHRAWPEIHVIILSSSTRKGAPECHCAFDHGAEACFDKARIVSCGRELSLLISEIAAHHIHRSAHRGDAVTLPDGRHHYGQHQLGLIADEGMLPLSA